MSLVSQAGNDKQVSKFKNAKKSKMKVKRFEDIPLGVKLVTAGTAACIADTFTFPLDTAKVRLQVQGEGLTAGQGKMALRYRGVLSTVTTIAREEGPKSLYNGLMAGLQRQMCFASIRLGLYDTVKDFYEKLINDEGKKRGLLLDVLARISAGVTTGALAVVIAQPTDVVKVRFQAQRGSGERYTSTTEAYKTIFRDEGVRGLWKGAFPNVARNGIVNVSEIVCYDIAKDVILRNGLLPDNIVCHFFSAVVAGFCTTVASSPVDVVKTRYMNSPPGQYKSAVDCGVQTLLKEGPLAFYKGFTPMTTESTPSLGKIVRNCCLSYFPLVLNVVTLLTFYTTSFGSFFKSGLLFPCRNFMNHPGKPDD